MTERLVLSREDLLRSHPYARPHEEAGYRLHGGFLADGTYASPRTLVRTPAVEAWAHSLLDRGGELIDVSRDILPTRTWPNYDQSRLLLRHGLGRTFWTALTTTGIVEARGGALCQVAAPDFQPLVEEDLTATATGHLNAGLLWAHGADEAGDPGDRTEGAHDLMWFAVRDMVFAKDAYPTPDVPRSIGAEAVREIPEIPAAHETLVKFLMNVLIIEVRAEAFFSHCCRLLRDPDLFVDRREAAERAAVIVERIRQDEAIHVAYLQAFLSELRSFTFRTQGGGAVKGARLFDPVWDRLRGVTQPERQQATYAAIRQEAEQVLGVEAGAALVRAFDALETAPAPVPA